jgi:CD2 antigen cytoplasmic tail-binding protein 2
MRSEQEEGAFDETGNYVRRTGDPEEKLDNWMEGVSKKEMRRAKEAMDKRDQDRRKEEGDARALTKGEALKMCITGLEVGETVLEALARLGAEKKKFISSTSTKSGSKAKPKWQRKPKSTPAANGSSNGHTDVNMTDTIPNTTTNDNPNATQLEKIKKQILDLTTAADHLLTLGNTQIYDTEREMLIRLYQRETGETYNSPSPSPAAEQKDTAADAGKQSEGEWQYRWTDARDGGNINGPYPSSTMKAWNEAGYFGEGVEFRKVGGGGSEWSRVADF